MRLPWQRRMDEPDDGVTRSATAARDERLSEYLDGLLSRPDRAGIEADAERDSDLRLALEGMRAVRANLGELGMVRAPRSFVLAPELAPRRPGLPRLELYARLATMAAALALALTTLAPSFTGGVEERAATSMSESFDAAQEPTLARKQAADQGALAQAPQPATAASGARAAAPAPEGSFGAGTAPQAPQSEPLSTQPGAPAATAAAELPPPSEQPVPLSNGVDDAASSPFWLAQLGLAVATSVLAALTMGLWLRRRAAGAG